jgi:hypothetical protein
VNFDNTFLVDKAKCDAAFLARHKFGLVSKEQKLAADIGNAFHAGLMAHFQGATKRTVSEVFVQAYDRVVKFGEVPEEERFERNNCIAIMERYCDVRPVDKFPFNVIETEVVRGMELAPGYNFWVTRDLLGQDKQSGFLVPVDHKTTRLLTAWFARKYRLTSQMTGYAWFTAQEFQQPVHDCYINALEIGKLPNSDKRCNKHSTPGNTVKFSQCFAQHANFQLYQYTRAEHQIERWKQEALAFAKEAEMLMRAFSELEMLQYARRDGAFKDSCTFCEHKEWCAAGFKPQMAQGMTVYEPWSPWDRGQLVTPGWRRQG